MIIYSSTDIENMERDVVALNHISQQIIDILTLVPVKKKYKSNVRDNPKNHEITRDILNKPEITLNPNKKKKDLCNEIQSEINKVSEKNYDSQFKKIATAIMFLQSNDHEKYTIAIDKAYKLLSNNVFMVDTYSKIYKGLVDIHPSINILLQKDIILYEECLEKMIYDVSCEQSEYEQFCDKNTIKLNKIGLTVFFIKLCDLKQIDKSQIQRLCIMTQNIMWKKINDNEATTEDVEFLCNIVYTLFKSGLHILRDDSDDWKSIKLNLNRIISNYKKINSISNKLYFKHLDINDIIKS
jgi:hypothetical protein